MSCLNIIHDVNLRRNGHEVNSFHNEQFFNILLNKLMPYLPLWSSIFSDTGRKNNALVENYFGQLKRWILEERKHLKCSQFLRYIREDILALTKECQLNIPKNRLTKTDISSEKGARETWSRKKKSTYSHFQGSI